MLKYEKYFYTKRKVMRAAKNKNKKVKIMFIYLVIGSIRIL